jgi:hypothetical protein
MKKHIAPEGALFKYRLKRISSGYIVEENYVVARSLDEATELAEDDNNLERDWEIVDDQMSEEEVIVKRCNSEEKEHA